MNRFVSCAVAAVALGFAGSALAAPIQSGSTLSITGIDNVSSTQITFPQNGNLLVSTGSFGALGTCVGCVALNTITFSPNVTSGQIFSVSNLGLTSTFTLDPGATAQVTTGPLGTVGVLGTGTATLTGFDPTRGQFAFSTQNGVPQTVTFSATVTAVPEPASLALFGAGLLGLGMVRRRQARAA